MKRIILIVSLLTVAAACSAPPTNQGPATSTNRATEPTSVTGVSQAEIVEKEKAVWEALKKKDYDGFANMLGTEFVEVGSDGVYDKAGIVRYLKDLEIVDLAFGDWLMIPIDKDAALLIYNVNVDGKFKGEKIPLGPYRAASAWVNRDGKWQAIYYQETLAEKSPTPSASSAATTSASPATRTGELTLPEDAVEREKMVWDALKRKDYDAFASFLDDGQIEVERDGVYDKAGTLKGVRTFDASSSELGDFKTVKFTDASSLVTYFVKIPGSPLVQERASTIWVNRGGKWRALFHQGTPAASPAASPAK